MCFKNAVLVSLLLAGLPDQLAAQTYTNLYAFTDGADGASPWSSLVLVQNTLYGTTYSGGNGAAGTIFTVNTDGSGFTDLHQFTTGPDGGNPYPGMILSGNTLYGTAFTGGDTGNGAIFSMSTDGSIFKTVYSFAGGTGGAEPRGGLVLSGNTLYGTTQIGGTSPQGGTVFAVNTEGTNFNILHNFSGGNDGVQPYAGLTLSGNTLYGTTLQGGSSGNGIVYAVNTDSTGFTNLHTFTSTTATDQVNNDGANPWAGLLLVGKTLYGTAAYGGSSGSGTIFSLNTDGSGFTVVHSFGSLSGPSLVNIDGANPIGGLIVSGDTLYGTAQDGGTWGAGTIFSVKTNGTNFRTLYNFSTIAVLNSPNADGAYPVGALLLSGTTLYGTANSGGPGGFGSVFGLPIPSPPPISIQAIGNKVILTWPTNATGFVLQSTTNLDSPSVWNPVSIPPSVVNGQNTVTNPISNNQQLFRLAK